MIIIDNISQQSPEWYRLHAGVPGASSFSRIVTTKGEPSKSQQDYIYELASEKMTGTREQGYMSFAMEQGIIREEEARVFYELITGESISQVGFVFKDKERRVGCSPDGLLGLQNPITKNPSGLEIKCPLGKTHVKYLLSGKLPTDYFIQVQGSMWVSGFNKWVFMSYYPGMPPFILEVERDYKFTSALEVEMEAFLEELETVTKILGCTAH